MNNGINRKEGSDAEEQSLRGCQCHGRALSISPPINPNEKHFSLGLSQPKKKKALRGWAMNTRRGSVVFSVIWIKI